MIRSQYSQSAAVRQEGRGDIQKFLTNFRGWSTPTGRRASVNQAVDSVYGKLGENAKKQLAEYYGDKIRTAQEQVEQSAMVARQDEERKAEIRTAVSEIREILSQIQTELEGMA